MKTVRANTMFVIKIFWNSHAVGYRWHRLVEGCVKYCHLPGAGKNFPGNLYTQVIRWIVKGRQWKELLYFFLDLLINNDGIGKTFPSMNYTMPHDINFVWIFDNA